MLKKVRQVQFGGLTRVEDIVQDWLGNQDCCLTTLLQTFHSSSFRTTPMEVLLVGCGEVQ